MRDPGTDSQIGLGDELQVHPRKLQPTRPADNMQPRQEYTGRMRFSRLNWWWLQQAAD